MRFLFFLGCVFLLSLSDTQAQIVLLGDNAPYGNINDGDFNLVKGYWRQAKQSPFWKTKVVEGTGTIGLHYGTMFSMAEIAIAESKIIDTNIDCKKLEKGAVLNWSFGADLEYICDGTISVSLVFGTKERLLADRVKLVGSDKKVEHFTGRYTLTKEDEKEGFPFVRVTFYSGNDVKVYLHYINVYVETKARQGLVLKPLHATKKGIALEWNTTSEQQKTYTIFRNRIGKTTYKEIGSTAAQIYIDTSFIPGVTYNYMLVEANGKRRSNREDIVVRDTIVPKPSVFKSAVAKDCEITLHWSKNNALDFDSYILYRGNGLNGEKREIARGLKKESYVDFTPLKELDNYYYVKTVDYSGNMSEFSNPIVGRLKTVKGTSFSDLLQPMPVKSNAWKYENIWGGTNVIPRNIANGIEDENWSYWGGRPVRDTDGLYHMNVTRWPANATKGHWEWPNSTVAYAVAKQPTGPYKIVRDTAYDLNKGLGHNPDMITLNDGTYLMYVLMNWKPVLLHSKKMSGPWQKLGEMKIDLDSSTEPKALDYRYSRNLSGVHLDDGRFLFVSKAGAMLLSETTNPLGPYKIVTKPLQYNTIIPEKYRNSNYEDPVLWKDEVQFHLLINAFLDYRAIYLRSENGIDWKFNSGTAFTPDNTVYTNGKRTHWHKLERPHVLQDAYGRATHLSLAVIDVAKADDLARDNHNSKNIIVPLIVQKRMQLLSTIYKKGATIKVKLFSEKGFDAQQDIDLKTLRLGATEQVDVGKGCKLLKATKAGKDIVLEFEPEAHGLTKRNFVIKLLGKTKTGELLFSYTKFNKEEL